MTSMLSLTDPTNFGNPADSGPLRPGGWSLSEPMKSDSDLPSTASGQAKAQQHAVRVCRDSYAGTERVRDQLGHLYLPRLEAETQGDWQARLLRSVFFNAFRRTVEGLTGLVFRNDPVLGEDVPPQMVEHWENIDLAGTHGDVFARELLQDALITGHAAVLVDFPSTGGNQTAADEMGRFPLRPYWVPIRKEQILSWRTSVVAGRTVLEQVVIEEHVAVPDGAFGSKPETHYRVLSLDENGPAWKLLEVTSDRRILTLAEGRFANQTEIPLAEIPTSGRRSMFDSSPPLLDLAYLNLAHYQQASDYAVSLHKSSVPLLVLVAVDAPENPDGGGPGEVKVSANACLAIRRPDGDAKYISHDGAALGSARTALEDLKSEMATLGQAMLSPSKRAAETAEAKRLDKSASDAPLAVSARGLQDGLERALQFHANYLKLPSGGSISVNRDFEGALMDPPTMAAWVSLVRDMGIPGRVALKALAAGGRLPDDEAADIAALELEMAINRQAQQDSEDERRRNEEVAE